MRLALPPVALFSLAAFSLAAPALAVPKHIPKGGPAKASPAPHRPPPAKSGLPPAQRQAAGDALKALRRLGAAASVGVTFADYQSRLIDTKAAVDECLRVIPEGGLRTNILASMQGYQDASTFWNDCNQIVTRKDIKSGASGAILTKYGLTLPDIDAEKHKQTEADSARFDAQKEAVKRSHDAGAADPYGVELMGSILHDMADDAAEESKIDAPDQNRILSGIWAVAGEKEQAADDLLIKAK